ncbi:hypothetical protein PR048_005785 [Dryococelus australis]|uniref:Uncharacterized protein n=1 Tax=Dryococelus australis TaxID=614101 RepID=A0ABQ9IA91_9NEOP|nr:hypothetical protein PR048_005785 [Dryococelus australis]
MQKAPHTMELLVGTVGHSTFKRGSRRLPRRLQNRIWQPIEFGGRLHSGRTVTRRQSRSCYATHPRHTVTRVRRCSGRSGRRRKRRHDDRPALLTARIFYCDGRGVLTACRTMKRSYLLVNRPSRPEFFRTHLAVQRLVECAVGASCVFTELESVTHTTQTATNVLFDGLQLSLMEGHIFPVVTRPSKPHYAQIEHISGCRDRCIKTLLGETKLCALERTKKRTCFFHANPWTVAWLGVKLPFELLILEAGSARSATIITGRRRLADYKPAWKQLNRRMAQAAPPRSSVTQILEANFSFSLLSYRRLRSQTSDVQRMRLSAFSRNIKGARKNDRTNLLGDTVVAATNKGTNSARDAASTCTANKVPARQLEKAKREMRVQDSSSFCTRFSLSDDGLSKMKVRTKRHEACISWDNAVSEHLVQFVRYFGPLFSKECTGNRQETERKCLKKINDLDPSVLQKQENCSRDGFGNRATAAERLAGSPPTKANWVQSPGGPLPGFCKWELCLTMPPVGGFSRGSPVSPTLEFRRRTILASFHPHRLSLLNATKISQQLKIKFTKKYVTPLEHGD